MLSASSSIDQALASLRIETKPIPKNSGWPPIRLSRACGLKQMYRLFWFLRRTIRLSRACGLKRCQTSQICELCQIRLSRACGLKHNMYHPFPFVSTDQALASLRIETFMASQAPDQSPIRLSRACGLKLLIVCHNRSRQPIRLSRACGLKQTDTVYGMSFPPDQALASLRIETYLEYGPAVSFKDQALASLRIETLALASA